MKKRLPLFLAVFGSLSMAPVFVFAQNITGVLGTILGILNTLIGIFIVLGVVYFVYGVITYVVSKGADDQKKAKDTIIQGLIGLFIIVAFWGIIRIVQNTFGLDNQNQIQTGDIPCVQGVNC